MKSMPKQIKEYALPAILLFVGLALGFVWGKSMGSGDIPVQTADSQNDLIYTSQSAIIRGKITSVDGNTLMVKNSRNDSTGSVMVSEKTVITSPGKNPTNLDLSKLETDKEVLINLEMVNGQYQAVSIQYTSPPPSLPPLPKTPAKSVPKPS
jgi:hypothetical protein